MCTTLLMILRFDGFRWGQPGDLRRNIKPKCHILLVFGLELTVKGENDGMQDRSQKRPTIWIVAVALLTLVVLIGILFMPGTDGRWDAMRTRVAKLRDEARSRNVSRPVLRGEPISGKVWDEYNIALNQALGDPFGKNLSFEKDGDKFKIWSNGRDGVNQNGQGNWRQTAGPDIVLEIVK